MAKLKLTTTQQDVVERMKATNEPLVRLSGGFWTLPSIAKAAGYTLVESRKGDPYWKSVAESAAAPSWWVGIQTLRALAKKGVLRHDTNSKDPEWARPFVLVPEAQWPEGKPRRKRPADVFTDAERVEAVTYLKAWEISQLDAVVDWNPFQRRGVTARTLATHLGFTDTFKARRLLLELVADGLVESTGVQRTLQAGSKPAECFAPAGFTQRMAAKEARN
jgi:hypothetical protein